MAGMGKTAGAENEKRVCVTLISFLVELRRIELLTS